MLDGSRNDAFRASGGSRSVVLEGDKDKEAVAGKLAERFRARKANQQQQGTAAAPTSVSPKAAAGSKKPEPPGRRTSDVNSGVASPVAAKKTADPKKKSDSKC
ncbi:hypothetical protein ADEAN_000908300 [Angomonas deanei]|uniref:Uncharacterized protein n=1 Tax=Angomonas deanei TaxID=59799 RepID=A0A7G2CRB7_9TRYP|nr:hypothetical protein ADEAN_000908300 [Angomonas deanei]